MDTIEYLDRLIKVYELTGESAYMQRIERVCNHIEKNVLAIVKEGESSE